MAAASSAAVAACGPTPPAGAAAAWAHLPRDTLLCVLAACAHGVAEPAEAAAAVAAAACACRSWRDAAQVGTVWRGLYLKRWGAPPASAAVTCWRGAYAARHALPAAVRAAVRAAEVPQARAAPLAHICRLERELPGLALAEAQQLLRASCEPAARAAAARCVSELAVEALRDVAAAPPRDEAAALLDAACAVALLVDPAAPVHAARAAVARLGAAAKERLAHVPPAQRVLALNAFLFGRAFDSDPHAEPPDALPSLLPDDCGGAARIDDAILLGAASGGLGFGVSRRGYHSPRSSSLAELLRTRRGTPAVLAVLHVVVGAAAGVSLQPAGVPRHFMTRTPAGAPGEPLLFDAAAAGAPRSRATVAAMLADIGIVPSEELLAPTPAREVAARMVRTLLSMDDDALGEQALPLLSAAVALTDHNERPRDASELRLRRFQQALRARETQLAQADFEALTRRAPGAPPFPAALRLSMAGMLAEAAAPERPDTPPRW